MVLHHPVTAAHTLYKAPTGPVEPRYSQESNFLSLDFKIAVTGDFTALQSVPGSLTVRYWVHGHPSLGGDANLPTLTWVQFGSGIHILLFRYIKGLSLHCPHVTKREVGVSKMEHPWRGFREYRSFNRRNILEGANRTFIPLTQLTLIIDEGHVLHSTKGVG